VTARHVPRTDGPPDHLSEPASIRAARAALPIDAIHEEVRAALAAAVPALAGYVDALPPKVFGVESGFFHLPVAQALLWGLPADEWLRGLGTAVALGSVHYAAQDIVVDTGDCTTELVLVCDAAQTAYLRQLHRLCPDEKCARHHDRYFERYCAALIADRRHRDAVIPFGAEDVLRLADKAAPLFLGFPLAMARTPHGGPPLSDVERALRHLCVGLQLHDDVADIAEDLAQGYFSFPATVTLLRRMGHPPGPVRPGLDHAEVEARMYLDGVAAASYELATRHFEHGAVVAASAGVQAVADLADHWRARTGARLRHVEESAKWAAEYGR